MGDADILDIYAVDGKECNNFGKRCGVILDVHMDDKAPVPCAAPCLGETAAVSARAVKEIVDIFGAAARDTVFDLFQNPDIGIEKFYNIPAVGQADFPPHFSRRRGNSRNVLEAAGRNRVHDSIRIIGAPHQFHEGSTDDMRYMADTRNREIMARRFQEQRQGPDALDKTAKKSCFILSGSRLGRQ